MAFEHIAEQAKDSFAHLKLLMEYAYGKPKEYREIENLVFEQPLFPDPKPFPYDKLSDSALMELESILAED